MLNEAFKKMMSDDPKVVEEGLDNALTILAFISLAKGVTSSRLAMCLSAQVLSLVDGTMEAMVNDDK